jgi:hypothetical protein
LSPPGGKDCAIEFDNELTDNSSDGSSKRGRGNVKEIGVHQEMYDSLKQKMIEKETEMEKFE